MGHLPGGYTDPFMNDISIVTNGVSHGFPVTKPTRWKILQTKISRISPLIREITFSGPLPKGFPWVPSVSPKRSRLPSKIAPDHGEPRWILHFLVAVIWPIVFEGWKKTLHFPMLGSKGTGNIRMFFLVGFRGLIHFFGEVSYWVTQ